MRSNATILVSYSCRRSAAWASAFQASGFVLLDPDADQLAREAAMIDRLLYTLIALALLAGHGNSEC
jgi:hypothetical protein